jgi:hypothetical protein
VQPLDILVEHVAAMPDDPESSMGLLRLAQKLHR